MIKLLGAAYMQVVWKLVRSRYQQRHHSVVSDWRELIMVFLAKASRAELLKDFREV